VGVLVGARKGAVPLPRPLRVRENCKGCADLGGIGHRARIASNHLESLRKSMGLWNGITSPQGELRMLLQRNALNGNFLEEWELS